MSQIKRVNLGLIIIFAIASFFMFGCEKSTPVNDIHFSLNEGEQIVLMVGQTLEMKDRISITPSYATNQKYSLTSFDENVLRIENNSLVAIAEGTTQIRVVSDDNSLKEDLMTVIVKKTKTVLTAPTNLIYNNATQLFAFDAVTYASSYTFRINGEEYDLGNSTLFSLGQYRGKAYDNLLVVQVKANAPSYTYALENSMYSDEYKIYQAGELQNVAITNGVLNYEKTSNALNVNVYLGNQLFVENTKETHVSFKTLTESYAGLNERVYVESVVADETKQQIGDDVTCFNSSKQVLDLKVLDAPEINFNTGVISWNNIAYSSGYDIYVDGKKQAHTENNYFDLSTLTNYDSLLTTDEVHSVMVDPLIGDNAQNVGKTTKESLISTRRLNSTSISCLGKSVVWEGVEKASHYVVILSKGDENVKTSMTLTSLDLTGYDAGDYNISVQAVGTNDGDVYLLPSETISFDFNKLETIDASIVDYKLKINYLNGDCLLTSDIDELNTTVNSTSSVYEIDLLDNTITAGEHSISLTRVANGNYVESDEITLKFTQLEPISQITIENGVAKIERSSINENATIKYVVLGKTLLTQDGDTIEFNTSNQGASDYLQAGTYEISVYVHGDGSSTFSYRDENGNVAACATTGFTVLPAPTLELQDSSEEILSISAIENAESYDVYSVENTTATLIQNVTTLTCDFEIESGTGYYVVQARGNASNVSGDCYLDSCLSDAISVTRLQAETLTYNSSTQIVSKSNINDNDLVAGFLFEKNGEVVSNYDFASEFEMTESTILALTTLANVKVGDEFYLNSLPYELSLRKISNNAEIHLDEENNLILEPLDHTEEYGLFVKFDLGGGNVYEFTSQGNKLISGDVELEYTYNEKYIIQLIKDYNTIIEEMGDNFSVDVQFVKESTGNDSTINSEIISQDLTLIRLDNTSTISVNANNEIVITLTNLTQECGLIVVINDSEDLTFASNGETLTSNDVTLEYYYDEDTFSYHIIILDKQYNHKHIAFASDFTISVKYMNRIDAEATDLDSDFTENTTIKVQSASTLSRDEQMLKFTKVNQTHTFENYALNVLNTISNEQFTLTLSEDMVNIYDGYFTIDVEHVYENVDVANLCDVYSVAVITLNQTESATANLSKKSNELLIQKAQTLEISASKDNEQENNSVVISLNIVQTPYDSKEYIFEIYNTGYTNKVTKRFVDSDAENDVISFNLDDVEIEGIIYVHAYINTTDDYEKENTIYVFNSNYSNELEFVEIETVQNLTISNSVLTFDSVDNAVGYEIYEKTTSGYSKINASLITSNQYEFTTFSGQKEIVVKAISQTDGYSNSNYSDSITVNKLASPEVGVENGKFKIELPAEVVTLLMSDTVNVIPEVTNGSNEVALDIGDIDINGGVDIFTGTVSGTLLSGDIQYTINIYTGESELICEPYLFLAYNSASILKENLSVQIKVEYTEPVDDVYYLNSNIVSISAYGLFAPQNVAKTTDNNNTVELFTWTASDKNVLNSTALSVGYVFKIEYESEGVTNTYYSNDSGLKYYDSSYLSYPSVITGTTAVFPAGYDEDGDGALDVKFGAGKYKVSVQTVPANTMIGYNICSSQYSSVYEFEILKQLEPTVQEGKLIWEKLEKASEYQVSIFEQNATEAILVDKTVESQYDFTTSKLSDGVFKVVVQALGGVSNNVLNSAESEPIYVYKLPEANAVSVDDGYLILSATAFFSKAKIEFVDTISGIVYEEIYDNSSVANEKLASITKWEDFTDNATIDENVKMAIKLDGEVTNILDGRDYTINVTLIGNSNTEKGFVNSSKMQAISSITATKLKANTNKIGLGTLQFKPDSNYATITETTYSDVLDMNYSFNGGTTSTNATFQKFWNDTMLYKIKITHSSGEISIYAIDYFSFITAFGVSEKSTDEYEILDHKDDTLFAIVKYPYDGGTLYFNVYNNNIINLKDYDVVSYYETTETLSGGENSFSSVLTKKTLSLTNGGSFSFNVSILGGDSYTNTVGAYIGYLSSNSSETQTFVRYGTNQLSTRNGKLQFNDLLPKVYDEKTQQYNIIDYPIYQIDLQGHKTFYLYYNIDEKSLENAKLATQDDTAEYVPVEKLEGFDDVLFFDLSAYVSSGKYSVTIRTLAGLGTSENQSNYLLSGKVSSSQSIYKLTDTTFTASNGVLKFEQSYYSVDTTNIYCDNYEVTIIDGAGNEYVYALEIDSTYISIIDSKPVVTYVLPKQVKGLTIESEIEYQIKIRAMSDENLVLNGTYATQDDEDVTLTFSKSNGVSNVKIENGVLKWQTSEENNAVIKITFSDENEQVKNIYIPTTGTKEGNTYYYQFSDGKYPFDTTGEDYISSGIEYSISVYIVGGGSVLNSDYSSPIIAERLSSVADDSIKTEDGILTWDAVDNAVSYEIIIKNGDEEYPATSNTNSLDVASELELPVGTYSVAIRAIGDGMITAITSNYIQEFVQLGAVDTTSIEFEGSDVTWDAIESAQGYLVELMVKKNGAWELFDETDSTTNSYTAPTGMSGEFKITITPIGVGTGKVFNGQPIEYASSTAVPTQVQSLSYNEDDYRFEIVVNGSDFNMGDQIEITYNLTKYTSSDVASVAPTGTEEQVTDMISWENGTTTYYYPLSIIGQYTDISVRVVRPNVWPSDAVIHTDITFRPFSYGAGTSESSYGIYNSDHLLNINAFSSANYELYQSINMSNVDVQSRLNNYGAVIASEFSGVLDGRTYVIYGFNKSGNTDTISLTDATTFALFGTLNGATIKNLTIGEQNIQLILSNTIANSPTNVLKLSLMATGANNSTLENINVPNCEIQVSTNSSIVYSKNLYVAGLVEEMSNSTISNSTVTVSIKIEIELGYVTSYIGGLTCKAENSNVNNTEIKISLSTVSTNEFTYVGGAIASYTDESRTQTISNTNVVFTNGDVDNNVNGVKARYIGGLVGSATYVNIDSCETSGSYVQKNITEQTDIGGLVGNATYVSISNSGSLIDFQLAIGVTNKQYIGAIVGYMANSNIDACYSEFYDENQERTDLSSGVSMGIYGGSSGTCSIENCKTSKE